MRHATHSFSVVLVVGALAGCPGGGGRIGDVCDGHSECSSSLQCIRDVCVPRCQRGPECGDGYACEPTGLCRLAEGLPGDVCTSEVDCSPGLSCQIDGTEVDINGLLLASCTAHEAGRPAGATCTTDEDCRNGTCALGHCADLCNETRDCEAGHSCMTIPRVRHELPAAAQGGLFRGCLLSGGTISWPIPTTAPRTEILLPVPSGAQFASLVFSVEDVAQKVGAASVISPSGALLYERPCLPGPACELDPAKYYANPVRHLPESGGSVLAMPSSPAVPLETGAYRIDASTFRANGTTGSGIPNVTAVVRIDSKIILDLHLHFLELEHHPCQAVLGDTTLDATSAQTAPAFQSEFLADLGAIFTTSGIAMGSVTYQDIDNHHDLDGLDIANAGSLLALGTRATGVNVFFVRTLSPVGLQAFGPSPGPAGVGGTRQSGVIIGIDTLCYRSWKQLARLTAHEIARYMGLYHNVELDSRWRDSIADSDDSPNNLMFFSELGGPGVPSGTDLSPGQRDILKRSPVLR